MTDKIEDSLENLSLVKNRRTSPAVKDQKQKQYYYSLKQKFVNALAKLQSPQTRQIALLEIKRIMDKNKQPEFIRMYLALMKSLKTQGTASSTKQHEILIFSHMSEIFGNNLIDPIDKPSSRIKTTFRIIQMLHLYFTDVSNTVQQACARVLIDLGKNVLSTQAQTDKIETETIINILFTPLASILKNGVDKASQATASVCINQLIQYWKININNPQYKEILNKICPQLLAVALKLNCEYHDFFMSLATMLEIKQLEFCGPKLYQFLNKMLGVINRLQKNTETTNFNAYMCKVNVCQIVERIGLLIQSKPEVKKKLDQLDVITALQKASRNRIIQVQMAAHRAIKVWNGEQIIKQRPNTPSNASNRGSFMSLQNARNDQKRKRSSSKQQKIQLQKQLNYMKEDLNQMVKGGWGAHKRANNYVKKNTGVGGGNCNKIDLSPDNKNGKSHKEEIQALRRFIKDNSKIHGQQDKFAFIEEKNNKKPKTQQVVQSKKNTQKQQPQQQRQPNQTKKRQNKKDEESIDFQLEQNEGEQNAMFAQDPNMPRNPYAQQIPNSKMKIKSKIKQTKRKDSLDLLNESNLQSVNLNIQQIYDLQQQQQQLLQWQRQRAANQNNKISKNQNIYKIKQQKLNNEQEALPSRVMKEIKQHQFERSLSMDQVSNISSNMLNVLNESDFNQLPNQTMKNITISSSHNMAKNGKGKQSAVSLALSESKYAQSPIRQQKKSSNNQFTLNPASHQNRNSQFNTFQQNQPQREQIEEIEEIVEFVDYRASNQAGTNKYSDIPVRNPQNYLPQQRNPHAIDDIYRRTVNHSQQMDYRHKKDQNQSEIYQQMIKNPPKLQHSPDRAEDLQDFRSQANSNFKNQEENKDDNITELWENVLKHVENDEINEAYSQVFEMEDHIYLLRLMLITQIPLKKLTPTNTCLLWQKFLQIYQHRFIDHIFVQLFSSANKFNGSKGLKNCLSLQQTNDMLMELYELSGRTKGKLSFNAAVLYNQVEGSINAYKTF